LKTLSAALAFAGFAFCGVGVLAAPKYPVVVELHGPVEWTNKGGESGRLKPKQVLIEKAGLQTGEGGDLVVQLDAHREFRLLPKSQVQLPAISWETGEAPVVILKSGSLRWRETPGRKYNIALRSDLFEFISPVGDFVFSYDPKTAVAEAKAVEGSMEFSAMNAEDVALLTAGQKVVFQGVREGEDIVYDVLLKGKKIPRGKLGLVEPLSAEEKRRYSKAEAEKQARTRRKKAAAEKKASEPAPDPKAICQKPQGRLNQCVWLCEQNPKTEKKRCRLELPEVRCLRRRCNANGEWAEESVMTGEKAQALCGVQPLVKDCDY